MSVMVGRLWIDYGIQIGKLINFQSFKGYCFFVCFIYVIKQDSRQDKFYGRCDWVGYEWFR